MNARPASLVILGVDPGLRQTGLGLVRAEGSEIRFAGSAVLPTSAKHPLSTRLRNLFAGLLQALHEWSPQVVVVEKLIYARNAQVAMTLGHVRGIVLLAAAQSGLTIAEYTPAEIKRAVTGTGAASKEQVQRMVKAILQVPHLRSPYDVTDALALAICHAHRRAGKVASRSATRRRSFPANA